MKIKRYKVIMNNEDDGFREEVLVEGSLQQCRKFLKGEIEELKEDDTIEIFNETQDWAEGIGHNGSFEYRVVEK